MVDFILAPLVSLSFSPLVWGVLRSKIPTLLVQVADMEICYRIFSRLRIAPETI